MVQTNTVLFTLVQVTMFHRNKKKEASLFFSNFPARVRQRWDMKFRLDQQSVRSPPLSWILSILQRAQFCTWLRLLWSNLILHNKSVSSALFPPLGYKRIPKACFFFVIKRSIFVIEIPNFMTYPDLNPSTATTSPNLNCLTYIVYSDQKPPPPPPWNLRL